MKYYQKITASIRYAYFMRILKKTYINDLNSIQYFSPTLKTPHSWNPL